MTPTYMMIPFITDINGSLWLTLRLPLALFATFWLILALTGLQLLFLFLQILARLTRPLLVSQHRCHADTLYPDLTDIHLHTATHHITFQRELQQGTRLFDAGDKTRMGGHERADQGKKDLLLDMEVAPRYALLTV